ncbi:hypothetical protein BCU68_12980 [Vibrio sp. 10N.286.49.B3]|uniref:EAL domain-containing protein n=1 Tax=Vibrio sp. 10N.286.49.B3 TaxID=1880855 RepID=UPI000C85FB12|nr:EAL domain-containing protein [Vibrio sp. 10N.286.49.B3]PMH43759.1 hypothetical protein BCU68_12980 [Vibrio sp. 10N.286.49.B3]
MHSNITSSNNLTIGVVLPQLSGFYMGEITACLRRLAQQHHFNLVLIRTGASTNFNLPLALEKLDGLITVLHSASFQLVEQAIEKNIAVVSMGGSYYPLAVEQVESDQCDGVTKAVQLFIEQGLTKIGFCGNLGVNDIRIRFKSYVEKLKEHNITFSPDWLFNVTESTLPGGRQAARMFHEKRSDCEAIVCATDYNAVGLIEQLQSLGTQIPKDVAIASIDNTYLGSRLKPSLTSVDQNLELVTEKAVTQILDQINGGNVLKETTLVPQQLKIRQSCGSPVSMQHKTEVSILRQLVDKESLNTTEKINESFLDLAQNGFKSIQNLPSIFGSSHYWACSAEWNSQHSSILSIRDFCVRGEIDRQLNENNFVNCHVKRYPPEQLFNYSLPDHYIITLVPISTDNKIHWTIMAVVDDLDKDYSLSGYSMFNNYLDMLSLFIERDSLIESVKSREKKSQELAHQLGVVAKTSNDGIWDWDLQTNNVHWNPRLLEMIGFKSVIAQQQNQHMGFCERIHPDDLSIVERKLQLHFEHDIPFKLHYRIQASDNTYLWVDASGEAVRNNKGQPVRFIGSMTDITEQKRSAEKIEAMAYYDTLTGIPNRQMMTDTMSHHINNNSETSQVVMLMDLDRFKFVNDTFGHDVGDALLQHVASSIKEAVRDDDFISRFGGDEFVCFCNIDNEEDALILGQRILQSIEKPFIHQNIELSTHGSIGIAFYPKDAQTSDGLLKKADIAMYKAKQTRNTHVMLYNPTMDADVKFQMTLEQQLKQALDKDELEVHFQPKFNPHTNEIYGFESLARWHSPVLGHVSPAQFIPVAEESSLICKLGAQIARKSVRQQVEWHKKHPHQPPLKLSINISPGQLMRSNFAHEFINIIRSEGGDPNNIIVEITESAAIANLENSRIMLNELASVGIKIALDDFGTGYSSLSLLQQLPLDIVKIDRSFIADIHNQKSSRDIVNAIVMLCHSFSYETVAEGVETKEELNLVKDIGCDLIQGFIYSPALKAQDFEKYYFSPTAEPCL